VISPPFRSNRNSASDWAALPKSPAIFPLVGFGFSRFQFLIFDQQQIALASEFIRFAKRNIALA
jgi:hypothetical protein